MSYDGYIEKSFRGDTVTLAEIAFLKTSGRDLRLRDTAGLCCEAAPVLANAFEWMQANPDHLREMNPANGWGDYDGALQYLGHAADCCAIYVDMPTARLRWSV